MGCLCSSDYTPVVPLNVQDDPEEDQPMTTATVMFGTLYSRDYGIYRGTEPPKSGKEKEEQLWLWFNKSTDENDRRFGIIDLENFVRPKDEPMGKGQVLWSARVQEKPMFEQTHSTHWFTNHCYMGAYSGYNSDGEDYMWKHPSQSNNIQGEKVGPTIYTKWKMENDIPLTTGNTGRGKKTPFPEENRKFGEHGYCLRVFAKGSGMTWWEKHVSYYEDADGNTQRREEIQKKTREYVDRIEFMLCYNGNEVNRWYTPGDGNASMWGASKLTVNADPLFESEVQGGFFKRSYVVCTTKQGCPIDPALATLICHVCSTEYSVNEIKRDLVLSTPRNPPSAGMYSNWNQQRAHGGHGGGMSSNMMKYAGRAAGTASTMGDMAGPAGEMFGQGADWTGGAAGDAAAATGEFMGNAADQAADIGGAVAGAIGGLF